MKRRRTPRQELSDRSRLARAWKRSHREQLEAALAGVHGAMFERLMAQLKDLRSARELVDFIAIQDWSAVDADTRFTALHRINIAITALRERHGLAPLPGQPENAFRIIRKIMTNFPPNAGKQTEVIR
jgi:hypothetical protein